MAQGASNWFVPASAMIDREQFVSTIHHADSCAKSWLTTQWVPLASPDRLLRSTAYSVSGPKTTDC